MELTPDQERLLLEGLTNYRAAFDQVVGVVHELNTRVSALEEQIRELNPGLLPTEH